MLSQEKRKQQAKARCTLCTIIIYLCIFSIGLAFGEVITTKTLEPKLLCYKYFDTTSYRKVSGKIQCKIKHGYFQVIPQSKIDAYRRLN